MTTQAPTVETLIIDMDNTLYDWLAHFVPALSAMTAVAAEILGTTESKLREELRRVHQFHGNTEHPFALLETESALRIQASEPRSTSYRRLLPAFEAFNQERNKRLQLYVGVRETLNAVHATGCLIVGHTDATTANIKKRIDILNVGSIVDIVYATQFEGPPHPLAGERTDADSQMPIRTVPNNYRKPNPQAVLSILSEIGAKKQTALYVGDSLTNDVSMAQQAGIMAAWAKYGIHDDSALWTQLVEVSHWRGPALQKPGRKPALTNSVQVLESFDDLLNLYTFAGTN